MILFLLNRLYIYCDDKFFENDRSNWCDRINDGL